MEQERIELCAWTGRREFAHSEGHEPVVSVGC